MADGFEYGNTRLRARKAGLLDATAYDGLLGTDVDGMLASLTETPYRPDVEAALPRARGLGCLHEALRTHLARTLTELRGFYGGRPGREVDLLVRRWDVRNLRTILRGQARLAGAEEVVPLLVPVGALDETTLRQLALQPGLRAAIDLMVAWGVPDPDVARALLAAWPAFVAGGDPAVLEATLDRAWAARLAAAVPDLPEPMVRMLGRETDLTNVLVALRLREARARGEPLAGDERFLAGGVVAPGVLGTAVGSDEPAAARLLASAPLPSTWRSALARFAARPDLVVLAEELEAALAREAIAMFATGDPLGIAVPIAFTWAKETEARNLRLVGQAVTAGTPAALVRDRLVLVDGSASWLG
jgi:V/A-type H+-transporting ATPase subunit C